MTDENVNVSAEAPASEAVGAPTQEVKISSGEKLLSVLGYISYFCVLPLVLRPDSKFCQLHGKQGLVITIAFMLFSWMGWVSSLAASFLFFLHVVIALVCIIQAARGVAFKFPGIYEVVKQLNLKD